MDLSFWQDVPVQHTWHSTHSRLACPRWYWTSSSDKTCQFNIHDSQHTLDSCVHACSGLVLLTRRASSTHMTLHSSPTRPTLSSTTLGFGSAPHSPSSLEWHHHRQRCLHRFFFLLHLAASTQCRRFFVLDYLRYMFVTSFWQRVIALFGLAFRRDQSLIWGTAQIRS